MSFLNLMGMALGSVAKAVVTKGPLTTSPVGITMVGAVVNGLLDYGLPKLDGTHDHRYNRGGDRTRAQKSGDASRKK